MSQHVLAVARRINPPSHSGFYGIAAVLVVGYVFREGLHVERYHTHSFVETLVTKWHLALAHIARVCHRDIVQFLAPLECWLVAIVALVGGCSELICEV